MKTRTGNICFKFWGAGFFLAVVVLRACALSYTFSNTNFMVIDNSVSPLTKAIPYPSAVTVTGLTGMVITKVTVTLHGLSHDFPSDVSVLLVGPKGQSAIVMSETGGQIKYGVTNLTLTLDDDAVNSLPVYSNLVSGTFKPSNGYLALGYPTLPYDFPGPAPPGNSNSLPTFSLFKNSDPDGTWNLFVLCDSSGTDKGALSNGWSLGISVAVPLQIMRYRTNVVISWPASANNSHLESLSGLPHSSSWSNVLTTPFLSSGTFFVTNPISSGTAFYRLVGN